MKKIIASFLLLTVVTGCNNTTSFMPDSLIQSSSITSSGKTDTLQGQILVNGTSNLVMQPLNTADLSFSFKDPAGQPVNQFELEHDKYMHLIVVSSDLSNFAHLHPTLENDGTFRQIINKETNDPDNQDSIKAVTKPGKYFLFSEEKPKGQDLQNTQFALTASGQENPLPITVDPQVKPGLFQKYFTDKSETGKPGDKYSVKLQVMKMTGMVHLNFTVQQNLKPGATDYKDVTDLQPWLGMTGHAILISKEGNTAREKVFRHLHAGHHDHGMTGMGMDMGTGPKLEFMLMDDQIPPAGVYKIWGQFKHHNQVFAVPFVFQL